ncbi:EAL domain-containing protein [Fulvimarina sp. 2208YS6-2-32]|uniref:EAL domain-containing protein n=1 Tax=Fulvimarina uroteuthidis TaxID=3098149 RepID=A0ABU5HWT1_9HYPH|nr:EAL domain-containing protein [Fulvimarina sp. 2208YS6-2-32]MDY8107597.1 EAL domain-containing protein [Fulvimarina sp. 2208YS6-2-32]
MSKTSCVGCRTSKPLGFAFSMAFQPIVDIVGERVWGYEALVRGLAGEGAWSILSQVTEEQRYRFDQACRTKAIELAAGLFDREGTRLSINFLPNAIYDPATCLRGTLAAARKNRLPLTSIMFEFTEGEQVVDVAHLHRIIEEYRRVGFITALDDFGAGYAGLGLLADFQPDLIKIDMHLVRNIDASPARRSIVAAILMVARQLDIMVLAEGIETEAELRELRSAGVRLMQGYYFAKPAFEALPSVDRATFEAHRIDGAADVGMIAAE